MFEVENVKPKLKMQNCGSPFDSAQDRQNFFMRINLLVRSS